VAPYGVRVLIVEPGSFRTGFGGGRMHRSRDSGIYADTAGRNRAFIDGIDGTQAGDPRRAAAAIVSALDAPDAPLRLALGGDAVDAIRAKHQRLRADLDAWEHVSRSTSYTGEAA
jgi:NAD(P)-dependent dehydrogenase (short-subunit alcohol dehydrogenase family)